MNSRIDNRDHYSIQSDINPHWYMLMKFKKRQQYDNLDDYKSPQTGMFNDCSHEWVRFHCYTMLRYKG